MSDLSRLLDDVYGDRAADAPAAAPEVPEEQREQQDWSADAVLDDAFADWVTDPSAAPGEHREPGEPASVEHEPAGDDQATVITSPLGVPRSSFTDFAEELVTETVVAPVPQATTGWQRDDDDILPTARRRRSVRGRSTGSTSPAAAPTAPAPGDEAALDLTWVDVAPGGEQPPEPTPRRFRLRRG